jgi:hypothetical protein
MYYRVLFALLDPTDGSIRWVGLATRMRSLLTVLHARRGAHWGPAASWLQSLWDEGLDPQIRVLAIVEAGPYASVTLRRLIERLHDRNVPLLNPPGKRRKRAMVARRSPTYLPLEQLPTTGLPTAMLDPIRDAATPFTSSRLAVIDGSPVPVLRQLASEKFGIPVDHFPQGMFPFWADGDPTNETRENVELAFREKKGPSID